MSVEFIGFITNNNSSETIVRNGPVLDVPISKPSQKRMRTPGSIAPCWRFIPTMPDGLQIGQHVLAVTDRLNVLIAQRPGFTAPTLIARQLATVDQLSGGRVALHVITGGNATELKQDGNTIDDKDERYARTDEFLDIVRSEWTSEKPFSYDGKYYKVQNGFSQDEAVSQRRNPHLRRRRLRCRDRGRGEARRHIRAMGRILCAGARRDGAGKSRGCEARPADAALQPVGASDPRRYRGEGMGQGRRDSGARHRAAGQDRLSQDRPTAMRPRVRVGCWRWRSRAPGSTSGCGPKLQNSRAPTVTPPRWSERPSRSPKCSATTTISASAISSFAVSIP